MYLMMLCHLNIIVPDGGAAILPTAAVTISTAETQSLTVPSTSNTESTTTTMMMATKVVFPFNKTETSPTMYVPDKC